MTNEERQEAIRIIKSECYISDMLNLDRTRMVNSALDKAVEALKAEPKIIDGLKRIKITEVPYKEISNDMTAYFDECRQLIFLGYITVELAKYRGWKWKVEENE